MILYVFDFVQVVMPTAEADVAFGLGSLELSHEEVRERVVKSLDAVGMSEYLQVTKRDSFL
jgi:energy-coupling factor transporter ATP-binding protein EcfA2